MEFDQGYVWLAKAYLSTENLSQAKKIISNNAKTYA